jgi:hypothetical protein
LLVETTLGSFTYTLWRSSLDWVHFWLCTRLVWIFAGLVSRQSILILHYRWAICLFIFWLILLLNQPLVFIISNKTTRLHNKVIVVLLLNHLVSFLLHQSKWALSRWLLIGIPIVVVLCLVWKYRRYVHRLFLHFLSWIFRN